jgi:hypothetical protein
VAGEGHRSNAGQYNTAPCPVIITIIAPNSSTVLTLFYLFDYPCKLFVMLKPFKAHASWGTGESQTTTPTLTRPQADN